jgi:hypothetical protein
MSHSQSPKTWCRSACHRFAAFDAEFGLEFRDAVVKDRVGFGQLVALPLLGDDVQELRPLEFLQVLQRRDQRIEVVAVDRADVVETEFFEQRAGRQHALDVLFDAVGEFEQRRRHAENFLAGLARGVEGAAGEERARYLLSAPTGGEIDMSLSLRMTSMLASATPALFSASKACPADMAPSPMMATVLRLSPLSLAAERHAERGGDRCR